MGPRRPTEAGTPLAGGVADGSVERRSRRPVAALSALIPSVLKGVEREHRALAAVQRLWREVAGRELAAHTKPVSLRRGRLVVSVEGPGDNFALSFQRKQIVDRLRDATGGKVDEMVIRPGDGTRKK